MQHKLYVEWETNSDSYVGSHATRTTQPYLHAFVNDIWDNQKFNSDTNIWQT